MKQFRPEKKCGRQAQNAEYDKESDSKFGLHWLARTQLGDYSLLHSTLPVSRS